MELPKDFCAMMRQQYGDEVAELLFEGLSAEPSVSIRFNTKKLPNYELCTINYELNKVPWCPDAYYLDERPAFTFDPLFHAGAYYVQEASSMYLAELLRKYAQPPHPPKGGERLDSSSYSVLPLQGGGGALALDLCAAPGGKSTLLASLLPEGSTLISNEPMPKRALVLAENMEKWTRGGYPVECYVTNNYPREFRAFTNAFDLLVTDVPCSGEGMFRKDDGAIRDWSLENVEMCWQRQREILSDIWHTLKPGALLIYCTCTFNHLEDEDNVRWIASELGADLLEERHFMPGTDRGEGFYCAALRKHDKAESATLNHQSSTFNLQSKLKTLRLVPPTMGEMNDEWPVVELDYNQALAYLRCEALRVEAPRGMVLLSYRGLILGPGKCVGNRINNLYPKEWRIRTTYTTPFTLG